MVYLIHSRRRPDASLNESAQSLSYTSDCPAFRVHRQPQAAAVVDIFFNEMAVELANGGRVEIRGLCSFHVREHGSYTGRNPKTGERVKIAPKKLPFIKVGRELKERVDR